MKALAAGLVFGILPGSIWGGTWGVGSFENDSALDWVDNVLEFKGADAVKETIALVNSIPDAPVEPLGSYTVAACEVLAAWRGRPTEDIPAEVVELTSKLPGKPDDKLREQARKALDRITNNSELRDLWADSPVKLREWLEKMKELRSRL